MAYGYGMTPDRMGPGDELGSTESRLKTSFTLVQALPRDLELEEKRKILHFYSHCYEK